MTCPRDVRSAHQSTHHLVAESDWSDRAFLRAVAGQVLPALVKGDALCMWIVDDTGFPKKRGHSVGVARQNCGQLGKTDNCHVAVSLSLPSEAGSLPPGLSGCTCPRGGPRTRGGVVGAQLPGEIGFATKGEIALSHIKAAGRGLVLADAAYGDEAVFRDRLTELGLGYDVGVRASGAVWWGGYQPLTVSVNSLAKAVGVNFGLIETSFRTRRTRVLPP